MDEYQQSQKSKLIKPVHGDLYLEPVHKCTASCPQCGEVYHLEHWNWPQNHRKEVLSLISTTETAEQSQQALERLLCNADQGNSVQVNPTGTHLTQRLGHGFNNASKGMFSCSYAPDEHHLTVHWLRG